MLIGLGLDWGMLREERPQGVGILQHSAVCRASGDGYFPQRIAAAVAEAAAAAAAAVVSAGAAQLSAGVRDECASFHGRLT